MVTRSSTLRTALFGACLVVTSCARGGGIGGEEAVELLVLDGLERRVAECVVTMVKNELELPEVTGVSGSLDSDELQILLEASAACRPAAGVSSEGTFGGPSLSTDLDALELLDSEMELLDATEVVADLMRGGYDPDLTICVANTLFQAPDAAIAVTDETRQLDAMLACEAAAEIAAD